MVTPKCFISYSHDNDNHKGWVRTLATDLQKKGVETSLDQWDAHPGKDLTTFMEKSIRESNFVLLICTTNFCEKANSGKGGVGYEKCIVTGEIFQGADEKKFIPILREGTKEKSVPSYIKTRLFLDFRNDENYDSNLEELLRHIHNAPKFMKPPLGTKPSFERDVNSDRNHLENPKQEDDSEIYRTVFDYASNYLGMNLSPEVAKHFAKNWVNKHSNKDFEIFKEVYKYSSAYDGMNLGAEAARKFADKWINKYSDRDFNEYQEVYKYSSAYDGMNIGAEAARKFADEWIDEYAGEDFSKFLKIYWSSQDFLDLAMEPTVARKYALKKLKEKEKPRRFWKLHRN